jgi:RNase H-fold protein (predicted Holliday junction resolvase)
MPRVITIDPGKSKCGLVLAEISERKVYKAIILKSESLEKYVRNLITAEDISKIIIGNRKTIFF